MRLQVRWEQPRVLYLDRGIGLRDQHTKMTYHWIRPLVTIPGLLRYRIAPGDAAKGKTLADIAGALIKIAVD